MEGRAKAGLIFLKSTWANHPEAEYVDSRLIENAGSIRQKLDANIEVAAQWTLDSIDQIGLAAGKIREFVGDIFILVYLNQADEQILAPVIQAVNGRPLIVWCYLPWRRIPKPLPFSDWIVGSGALGAFPAFSYLRAQKIAFLPVLGSIDDPAVIKDLENYARIARVLHELTSAHIGMVSSGSHFINRIRLYGENWIDIQRFTFDEIATQCKKTDEKAISKYLSTLKNAVIEQETSDATLNDSARLALAIQAIAKNHHLDLLAIPVSNREIADMHRICPGLPPDLDENPSIIFSPHIDSGEAIASILISRLARSPVFFLQPWFWDKNINIIVGGHRGIQCLSIADHETTAIHKSMYCDDLENLESAQIDYVAKSGRVSLLQLRETQEGWRGLAMTGVCLESDPWIDGIPHAVVRLDCTIEQFLDQITSTITSSHWVMVYGSVLMELKALAEFMNIQLDIVGS